MAHLEKINAMVNTAGSSDPYYNWLDLRVKSKNKKNSYFVSVSAVVGGLGTGRLSHLKIAFFSTS